MKTIPTYESSLRFARTIYGLLALIAFATHNSWILIFNAILMTVGVIYPNKSNGVYQLHRFFLRPSFKDKAKPILRGTDELRFACIFGSICLLGAFILIRLGIFIDIAWIFVLILSLVMLLSGIAGICAATLIYVFLIKRFLLKRPEEKIILPEAQLGDPNYVNQNCIIAKIISAPPVERCQYCQRNYRECPLFLFIVFGLVLLLLSLGVAFFVERELFLKAYKTILFLLLFFAVAYGYLFNKHATGIIKRN